MPIFFDSGSPEKVRAELSEKVRTTSLSLEARSLEARLLFEARVSFRVRVVSEGAALARAGHLRAQGRPS